MKKLVLLAVVVAMGFTLFGCGAGNVEKKLPGQKAQSGVVENTSEIAKDNSEAAKDNSEEVNNNPQEESANQPDKTVGNEVTQPKTKKIEVLVEGVKEMREATLAKSKYLGFQMYVLKGFSLESEEPGKDIVMSKYDGEFFARIEKLDGKIDLDEYKKQQKAGFQQSGKVTEIDPATLSHQKFRDSEFCLLTESGYSDNSSKKTSIYYLVKYFNGKLFAITFHMPLKEAAEGITPSLWAMLSTLEAQ